MGIRANIESNEMYESENRIITFSYISSEEICVNEEKLKVLIVEDEFYIGYLIKKLIKWEEIGLECIGVVDNGQSALEIIDELDPDIVITDIRMPNINGLDLIAITRQKKEHIKFIIVSGYKEFEYAHKALQYGINDYLLKPINEEEINKVLRGIHAELNQHRIKRKEEELLRKTITESRKIIKNKFLSNVVENIERGYTEDIIENYNLEFTGDAYRGINIKLDYRDYDNYDERQERLTVEQIVTIIEKYLKGLVKEQLICEKENLNIYCLINYDLSKSKEIKSSINNILTEIQEYLIKFELYEATIGIGCEVMEFGKIGLSISEAYKAVQNRVKVGTGKMIYSRSLPLDNKLNIDEFLSIYKEKYLTSIESYTREYLEQCINEIFWEIRTRDNVDFSCCYDIAEKLINLFFEHIEVKNQEGVTLKQYLLNACQHCYTLTGIKALLSRHLGNYLETSLKQLKLENVKPIRIAKQYINEHYCEKISLEDVAQMVGLNSAYFSVLFKKETGVNFSNYLIDLRMEKAKELLRSTNDTMVAIADSVGYKDTRYFSQLFTKTVGIKPTLYRRLHS